MWPENDLCAWLSNSIPRTLCLYHELLKRMLLQRAVEQDCTAFSHCLLSTTSSIHFQLSLLCLSVTIYHVDRLFSRTGYDASSRSDSQLRAPRLNCVPSYCNQSAFHLHSYIHRPLTIVYPIRCCAVAGFGWLWVPYIPHKYQMTNPGEYSFHYHWASRAPQACLTVGQH